MGERGEWISSALVDERKLALPFGRPVVCVSAVMWERRPFGTMTGSVLWVPVRMAPTGHLSPVLRLAAVLIQEDRPTVAPPNQGETRPSAGNGGQSAPVLPPGRLP